MFPPRYSLVDPWLRLTTQVPQPTCWHPVHVFLTRPLQCMQKATCIRKNAWRCTLNECILLNLCFLVWNTRPDVHLLLRHHKLPNLTQTLQRAQETIWGDTLRKVMKHIFSNWVLLIICCTTSVAVAHHKLDSNIATCATCARNILRKHIEKSNETYFWKLKLVIICFAATSSAMCAKCAKKNITRIANAVQCHN